MLWHSDVSWYFFSFIYLSVLVFNENTAFVIFVTYDFIIHVSQSSFLNGNSLEIALVVFYALFEKKEKKGLPMNGKP